MKKILFKSITNNLKEVQSLLENIDNLQYNDVSVGPYNSSIGAHVRHVLDIFYAIFSGIDSGEISFINRERGSFVETEISFGIALIDDVIKSLEKVDNENISLNQLVNITDDLGLGAITQMYTLGAALIQAHSHALHHFASLGYLIHQLDIELPSNDFGYNPTTPRN